jgi:hypothetical protein
MKTVKLLFEGACSGAAFIFLIFAGAMITVLVGKFGYILGGLLGLKNEFLFLFAIASIFVILGGLANVFFNHPRLKPIRIYLGRKFGEKKGDS